MISTKEKLYLLINALIEKCEPYLDEELNGAECISFTYSSINSFLKDCLLSVIDIPEDDESPSNYSAQEEFINLVSRFKYTYKGRKNQIAVYFPEIILTPELIKIIEDNNKLIYPGDYVT